LLRMRPAWLRHTLLNGHFSAFDSEVSIGRALYGEAAD
jgi:hypothetical protein